MKKAVIFAIGAVLFWCISCINGCNTLRGHVGVSDDIKESKRREVFICEYEASPNPYVINDSLQIFVKTAWLEKRWQYPKNNYETIPIDGFQLVIETNEENLKGYDKTWSIGLDAERYIRTCDKNCLMSDFDSLPTADKEVWQVQAGNSFNPETEKKIIGNFELIKK